MASRHPDDNNDSGTSFSFHSSISAEASRRYGRQLLVLITEWLKSYKHDRDLNCQKNATKNQCGCFDAEIIQKNIENASVLVVGAGGLGSPALLYLASAGIGKIGVVDGDRVEMSNLHRQIIHVEELVGVNKAESAKKAIKRLNSMVLCTAYPYALSNENADELIHEYDIVLDCTDDISAKILMNKVCLDKNKSFVTAAALRYEGQLLVFDRRSYSNLELNNAACYMCIAKTRGIEVKDMCSKFGILGPVTGVIGSLQAMEVIKIAAGLGRCVGLSPSRMVCYNAFNPINPFKCLQLNYKDANCSACGNGVEPIFRLDFPKDVDSITFDELKASERVNVLVDVRSKAQYCIGHLKNTVNWPTDEILHFANKNDYSNFIRELHNKCDVGRIDLICFVCRRGVESRRVAGTLKKLYNNSNAAFYSVQGGMQEFAQRAASKLPVL